MEKFVFSHSILMEDRAFKLVQFIVVPDIKGEVADEVLDQLERSFTKAIKDYVKTQLHTIYIPWENEYQHINQRLVLIPQIFN